MFIKRDCSKCIKLIPNYFRYIIDLPFVFTLYLHVNNKITSRTLLNGSLKIITDNISSVFSH